MRLDTATAERLVLAGESLTVEFKGEQHGSIADREIYETVVCLANTEGGVLLVGTEKDGTVTGALGAAQFGSAASPTRD